MDWIVTVISSLIAGGIGTTITAIYSARKNAQVGMTGNEVEAVKANTADWTAFSQQSNIVIERQAKRIDELEDENQQLNERRIEDLLWIATLTTHINSGKGPPAPERANQNGS